MKLFEQFAHRGYHSCLMTTFGIDFAAFENIVLHRLRGAGCNNNLVIADAGMLAHALEGVAELPRQAGRQYTVLGARSEGVFHPKVILQLGQKAGRVFVSSANLTAPGLAGNLEVIGHVAASPQKSGESGLLASAWHYVERFLDLDQDAVANQVARMRKQARWLMDVAPAEGVVSLASGEAAAFLESNGKRTIASQFATFLGGDPVKRLIVISPYWDENLKALRELHKATHAREVCVLVGGHSPSFPAQRLAKGEPIRLFPLLGMEQNRFVHAKVVIAQTSDADHVLYGSANCTIAGIGGGRVSARRNDEACFYRRMGRAAALRELHLETSLAKENMLKKTDLPKWQVGPEVPLKAALSRDPGRFVIRGANLFWWPTEAYDHRYARVELLGRAGTIVSVDLMHEEIPADEERRFVMRGLSEAPYFARVRIGDDVSVTTVIVMPDVLRKETREARSRQLQEIAARLEGRERIGPWIMDFIDLIAQAEALDTEPRPRQAPRAIREQRGIRPADLSNARTLSYEQFLAGRKVWEGRKPIYQQAFASSDLALVRNYLNRLIGLEATPVQQDEPSNDLTIRDALALRDEAPSNGNVDAWESPRRPTEGELFETRQKQLEEEEARKIIAARLASQTDIAGFSTKFCSQMRIRASEKPLVLQDMLRLRAILMMMLGASCPIGTGLLDNCVMESQVLRPDGDNAWPRLIGRVLSTFFAGSDPLIEALVVNDRDDVLPIELIECFATCFWAVQACRIAADVKKQMYGLGLQLGRLSAKIYERSGLTRAEREDEAVTAIFEKMTSTFSLGITPEEILSLHRVSAARRKPTGEPLPV